CPRREVTPPLRPHLPTAASPRALLHRRGAVPPLERRRPAPPGFRARPRRAPTARSLCERSVLRQRRSSEPLRQTRNFNGMLSIWTRDLAAKTRCGEHLARVTEARRIECASNALHGIEVVLAEHFRQVGFLICPDAMLTSNGSAGFDTVAKNL